MGIYWEQPLFLFGRIENSDDAAGARVTMASADEQIVEQDVNLKAAQACVAVQTEVLNSRKTELEAEKNLDIIWRCQ